jgi:hypothetical protein
LGSIFDETIDRICFIRYSTVFWNHIVKSFCC